MALVKCPECGKGISNKAKACPNCGYPLETEESIISIVPERETNIEYNCPYCNAAVNENDEYCDDCGMRITPYIEDIYVCRLSERSVFKNTTIFIKASKIC